MKSGTLRNVGGISGEAKVRKHDPCHPAIQCYLRGIKHKLMEQALSVVVGSAMEDRGLGRQM